MEDAIPTLATICATVKFPNQGSGASRAMKEADREEFLQPDRKAFAKAFMPGHA
jgi:hypothetical protein